MKAVVSSITYLVLTLLLCALVSTQSIAQSSPSAAWHTGNAFTIIENNQLLNPSELDALQQSQLGAYAGQACDSETIPYSEAGGFTYCWYETPIGKISAYGNIVKPSHSEYAGLFDSAQSRLVPLRDNRGVLELSRSFDGDGFIATFWKYDDVQLVASPDSPEGITSWETYGSGGLTIRGAGGSSLLMNENTVSTGFWYSANSRYLVLANYTGDQLFVIDLESLQLQTVKFSQENDQGNSYGLFAITNDGASVLVNLFGIQPRIINLKDCELLIGGDICTSTELGGALENYLPGTGGRIRFAEFKSNTELLFHYNGPTSLDGKYESFSMFAPATYQPGMAYLALGDSFASGEGAEEYYDGTKIEQNRCHLSKRSYPFLLGEKLNLPRVNSVACSGAKIQNIIGPELIDNELKDPNRSNQADTRLEDSELPDDLTPGIRLQLDIMRDERSDIITVSIGGNDAQFAKFIEACAKFGTCFQSDEERVMFLRSAISSYPRLVATYKELRNLLPPGGRAYALGYPYLVTDSGNCGNNVRLNAAEVRLTTQLTNYLNFLIARAAEEAGVAYIDMRDSLKGYRLCDNAPLAMRGLSLGFSRSAHNKWIFSQESFHPTAFGHRLLANTIAQKTNNLTEPIPRPYITPSGRPSLFDAVDFGILSDSNVVHEYERALLYAEFESGEVILKNQMVFWKIHGNYYNLGPNSPFVIELHSQPTQIGTFTTNQNGDLEIIATIPSDIEPGFHRIRAFGADANGTPIELRQVIYVAETEDDWDGDGVPNTKQPCVIALTKSAGVNDEYWCGKSAKSNSPVDVKPGQVAIKANQVEISNVSQSVSASPSAQEQKATTESPFEAFSAAIQPRGDYPDRKANTHMIIITLVLSVLALVCYVYIRRKLTK